MQISKLTFITYRNEVENATVTQKHNATRNDHSQIIQIKGGKKNKKMNRTGINLVSKNKAEVKSSDVSHRLRVLLRMA